MNGLDVFLVILIGAALFGAVRTCVLKRKAGGCAGCSGCGSTKDRSKKSCKYK